VKISKAELAQLATVSILPYMCYQSSICKYVSCSVKSHAHCDNMNWTGFLIDITSHNATIDTEVVPSHQINLIHENPDTGPRMVANLRLVLLFSELLNNRLW
jgi:hypothetical protein